MEPSTDQDLRELLDSLVKATQALQERLGHDAEPNGNRLSMLLARLGSCSTPREAMSALLSAARKLSGARYSRLTFSEIVGHPPLIASGSGGGPETHPARNGTDRAGRNEADLTNEVRDIDSGDVVAIPLEWAQQEVGSLELVFKEGRERPSGPILEDLRAIAGVAALIATTYVAPVYRNRPSGGSELGEQFDVMKSELQSWRAMTEKMLVASSLDEAVHSALAEIIKIADLPAACIYLHDETEDVLRVAAHIGMTDEFVEAVDHIKPGEGFSGRVLLKGEPIVTEDVSSDWRLTRPIVRRYGLRSYACIPIRGRARVIGTIAIIGPRTRSFRPLEIEFLVGIGRQVGLLLEMAERAYGRWSKKHLLHTLPSKVGQLTPRQMGILRLLGAGLTPRQIALRLDVSEKTVRNHISNMYAKVGVSDRGQLLLWAASNDLLVEPASSGS